MFKITICLMSLCIIASCATDDPVSREEILSEGQKPINIFQGELENIYFQGISQNEI